MSSLCEPCEYSKTKRLPTYKCKDCDELYCQNCSEWHVKFRAFRKHNVVKLEQQRATGPNPLYSGSDCLATGPNPLYSGSDALATGPNPLYSGSDCIAPNRQVIYAGSDDVKEDKKAIYSGSDAIATDKTIKSAGSKSLEMVENPFYAGGAQYIYSAAREDDLPINHFYIDVEDTAFSRKIGIQGQKCLLVVSRETASFSVSKDGVSIFSCSLKYVRRYGPKANSNIFSFGFGRRFTFGEGELDCKIRNAAELMLRLSDTMEVHLRKSNIGDNKKEWSKS